MKIIKLTQNKTTIVDDDDFEKLNQHKWYAYWDGFNFYAARMETGKPNRQTLRMHRVILGLGYSVQGSNIITDHINGNTLDNRKENLRIVTQKENARNRKLRKTNKLGISGICIERPDHKYWRYKVKDFDGNFIYTGKDFFKACCKRLSYEARLARAEK